MDGTTRHVFWVVLGSLYGGPAYWACVRAGPACQLGFALVSVGLHIGLHIPVGRGRRGHRLYCKQIQ
jgi:hypothetical protein